MNKGLFGRKLGRLPLFFNIKQSTLDNMLIAEP